MKRRPAHLFLHGPQYGRREARAISDARRQIEDLFRRYAAGVGGYVVARTGDPELAEAITSQVFALVVCKFDQCRESPAGWLWTIVRSELARHFRSRRAQMPLDGAGAALVDGGPAPVELLQQAESHQQLHQALKQLDEEQHTIVFMKFFQDLPHTEIAAALSITVNHVGVKVHRTLKRLRGLMEEADQMTDAGSGGSSGGIDAKPIGAQAQVHQAERS